MKSRSPKLKVLIEEAEGAKIINPPLSVIHYNRPCGDYSRGFFASILGQIIFFDDSAHGFYPTASRHPDGVYRSYYSGKKGLRLKNPSDQLFLDEVARELVNSMCYTQDEEENTYLLCIRGRHKDKRFYYEVYLQKNGVYYTKLNNNKMPFYTSCDQTAIDLALRVLFGGKPMPLIDFLSENGQYHGK